MESDAYAVELDKAGTQTKLCAGCNTAKPVAQFRRRRRCSEKRHGLCTACFAEYMRLYRRDRRRRSLNQFVQRAARQSPSVERMTTLCNAMLLRFGGVQQFSSEWHRAMDAASANPATCRFAVQSLNAMLNLTLVCGQRPPEPDLEEVSDDELESTLRSLLAEMIPLSQDDNGRPSLDRLCALVLRGEV